MIDHPFFIYLYSENIMTLLSPSFRRIVIFIKHFTIRDHLSYTSWYPEFTYAHVRSICDRGRNLYLALAVCIYVEVVV